MYTQAMDTMAREGAGKLERVLKPYEQALQQRIKTLVGISTTVNVLTPDTIERTLTGKARRVVDQRPK